MLTWDTWDTPTLLVSFGTRTGHSSWRGTTRSYLSVLRSLARLLVAFGGRWLCLVSRLLVEFGTLCFRTLGNL